MSCFVTFIPVLLVSMWIPTLEKHPNSLTQNNITDGETMRKVISSRFGGRNQKYMKRERETILAGTININMADIRIAVFFYFLGKKKINQSLRHKVRAQSPPLSSYFVHICEFIWKTISKSDFFSDIRRIFYLMRCNLLNVGKEKWYIICWERYSAYRGRHHQLIGREIWARE